VYESPVSLLWGPAASWVCLFVANNFQLPVTLVQSDHLLPCFGAVSIFLSSDYLIEYHCQWACSAHPAGCSAVVVVTVEVLLCCMYASKLYWLLDGLSIGAWVAPSLS